MTVKTEDELNTDFADGQFRGVTAEKIRNIIDSKFRNGGVMSCQNESVPVTTTFAAFPGMTTSTDTKQIDEDLLNGLYTIGAGGDGVYITLAHMKVTFTQAGDVDLALVRNTASTGFNDNDRIREVITQVTPTEESEIIPATLIIVAGLPLVEGDTIGLAWQASANVNLTVQDAQFLVARI